MDALLAVPSSVEEALARAHARVEIPVQWGDMDALGHVNNVVNYRWFECARIAFLERAGLGNLRAGGSTPGHAKASGAGCILQHAQARFRRPVFYPDVVTITSVLAHLVPDRMTLTHAAISAQQREIVTVGSSTIVAYDYEQGRKGEWGVKVSEACLALRGHRPSR